MRPGLPGRGPLTRLNGQEPDPVAAADRAEAEAAPDDRAEALVAPDDRAVVAEAEVAVAVAEAGC